ncbi:Pre-mRNA-processing protein 40B [Capsicum chinense]|nr:Pre-mRNA-processing protein 40B [Capsicum chinense]
MVLFPPLLAINMKFSPQNTPSFIKIAQELSLGFQNKNLSNSRFNRGFLKLIAYLESPERRLQETPIIFAYRGGCPKKVFECKGSSLETVFANMGIWYYYNKVTRTSKWRMPDEVKLAREKDTISHASDFGSISVVKTSSPGADGSLVSAHGAKLSPIAVSPAANLPTIVASESSSLSGKVSSLMIETVEMKNSSEPASPAVANSEKIGIALALGNSVVPPVSETTTAQDAVLYGDGFSSENRENVKKDTAITEIGGATPSDEKTVELGPLVYESKAAKSAFKTLLESVNIGSDCMWDQAMRAVINDRRYGALKSLGERKQAFNEEHVKALEEQKRNRVEYLEFLKACDFIKASSQWRKVQDHLETDERCSRLEKIDRLEIFQEYIRDLESEEEEQRKLRMQELRKVERKNHDEFRKLMEEHVAVGILNAKTNWHDYCINIKDFAAYLVVSSNTSGSTAKDLFTDVMDELTSGSTTKDLFTDVMDELEKQVK